MAAALGSGPTKKKKKEAPIELTGLGLDSGPFGLGEGADQGPLQMFIAIISLFMKANCFCAGPSQAPPGQKLW